MTLAACATCRSGDRPAKPDKSGRFQATSSRLRACHDSESDCRASRAPPRCAGACGSRCRSARSRWSPPAAAASAGATTAPTTVPSPVGTTAVTTASTVRAVTAQPLPSARSRVRRTRASRGPIANALCTPLVRYADAQGLPGTVIVPGLARDLPVVSRGSRTFRVQLLSGLRFADGRPLTTLDVRATFERLLDPATRSPGAALFNEIAGRRGVRGGGRRRTCAGCGRKRRAGHVHAQALGSGLPRAPRDADRVPGRRAARRTVRCPACWRATRPVATASRALLRR